MVERIVTDGGDAVGDANCSSLSSWALDQVRFGLVIENAIIAGIICVGFVNFYRGQGDAVLERIVPDSGDAVWYGHGGQVGAVEERIVLDGGHAVWYGH